MKKTIAMVLFLLFVSALILSGPRCNGGGNELTGRLVTVDQCGPSFPQNCLFFTGYDPGQGDPYEMTIPAEAMDQFQERCSLDEADMATHVSLKGTVEQENGSCNYAPLLVIEEYSFHH